MISDGNDTASATTVRELKTQIRETETLVYAIGIDGVGETPSRPPPPPRAPMPSPFPRPFPVRLAATAARRRPCRVSLRRGGGGGYRRGYPSDDRVNVVALRDMTDDSGGRTEIIRDPRDLNPATASIADELSKQYYLGYPSSGKRTAAGTRFASSCAIARIASARAGLRRNVDRRSIHQSAIRNPQ